MHPAIVAIAKGEQDYILEFVVYHISIGFASLYVYDNEDSPTYAALFDQAVKDNKLSPDYRERIHVTHFPGNHFEKGVQYKALDHFVDHYMRDASRGITHVLHIDIDEFLVFNPCHTKDNNHEPFLFTFIREFIENEPCAAGVGINWRFYGSLEINKEENKEEKQEEKSVLKRFLWANREYKEGDDVFPPCRHIKTLFRVDRFKKFRDCHSIESIAGTYVVDTHKNKIRNKSIIDNVFYDVAQLNHYKVKTFPEFKRAFLRGRADFSSEKNGDLTKYDDEYIRSIFNVYDQKDVKLE